VKPAIEAEGLVQRFGRSYALRGVDARLEVGGRLAVLGDNGAGKTTLLRLFATADRPAAGRLALFGLDVARHRAALRPRIGWLAHQPGLYGALTVRENLEFFCTLHGLPPSRATECLARLEIAADAERRAAELSRGRQQRLAIARTLLHDPELLVLDEPDTSLDAAGRDLLPALAEGRTLVVATHDHQLAARLADQALVLRSGAVAPPLRLVEKESS
jgi:ABC-type multidrug transport system ATPase subunit